jgi:hypothetical protein
MKIAGMNDRLPSKLPPVDFGVSITQSSRFVKPSEVNSSFGFASIRYTLARSKVISPR